MSTPSTTVYICSGVPFDNRYIHSVYFASQGDQLNYFEGTVVKTVPSCMFIRRKWELKLGASISEAHAWNYLYFRQSGKWYFYFITDVTYINDGNVSLSLELDVVQTYLFDGSVSLLPSFVEREHTATDGIGAHTLDEGLDTGEHRVLSSTDVNTLDELCVVVMATFDPLTTTKDHTNEVLCSTKDRVFSGVGFYAVEKDDYVAWGTKLQQLSEWGKIDGVINMFMYPKALIALDQNFAWGDGNVTKTINNYQARQVTIEKAYDVTNQYKPRNKKLYSYPFNFLYVTNNTGESAVYKYERMLSEKCNFQLYGASSPEGCVKLVPQTYNGVGLNFEAGLSLAPYPTCAWNVDTYKLWLAQNQNQQAHAGAVATIQAGVGLATGLGSLFTGNLTGATLGASQALSGLESIGALMAQRKDMEIQPPQARGSHSTSTNIVLKKHTFTIQSKRCSDEHLKVLDQFFDLYGYKVNTVKTPVLNNRPSYTYIKTRGCQVTGTLNNTDKVKLCSIFDNGITFWKNADHVGDYTVSNTV